MTEIESLNPNYRALSIEEIGHVSGGMVWERGTPNSNVIDARGRTV